MTAYLKIWDDYVMFAKLLDRMFDYLNRYYLKNQSLKPLGVTALDSFNNLLFNQVKDSFRDEVLKTFTKDRNGDIVDRGLMGRAVNCYVMQGLINATPKKDPSGFLWDGQRSITKYENEFERPFLDKLREEYETKAKIWISQCNAPEYLQKVEDAFNHEEQTSRQLL